MPGCVLAAVGAVLVTGMSYDGGLAVSDKLVAAEIPTTCCCYTLPLQPCNLAHRTAVLMLREKACRLLLFGPLCCCVSCYCCVCAALLCASVLSPAAVCRQCPTKQVLKAAPRPVELHFDPPPTTEI